MHVVTVEFVTAPEHATVFRNRVLQQADDSLTRESACHVFDVCVDPQRNERFLLYEVYEDNLAFEAHLKSAHFKAFDAAVKDWVVSKHVAVFNRVPTQAA